MADIVANGDPPARPGRRCPEDERVVRRVPALRRRRLAWPEKTGTCEVVLTTHDAETSPKTDFLTMAGWSRKALELCGAKSVPSVEEECRASGGSVCRHRVSWQ